MSKNSNHELAQIFKKLSAIYKLSGDKDRFRALAYQRVYRTIEGLEKDVHAYVRNGKMEKLQGIGESISEKIIEYLNTGKIHKYEELKANFPHELLDLLEVKGFGPRSLKKVYEELGIKTKAQLIKALEEGKISKLKGFGEKKTEQMKRGLKAHNVIEERMLLWEALQLGETIVLEMKKCSAVKIIKLAGSLRRRKETIGDIDLLVASSVQDRKSVVDHFISMEFVKEVLAKGDTKASILLVNNNRQVDLRVVDPSQWGAALQYFTGSKEHNVHLRGIAKEKGLKINEYGVFRLKDNTCIAGETEEEVYHALGFAPMPPEMREDKGEIELAKENNIPKLVTLKDIRGDMQMHSEWSDGNGSILEIAHYVRIHYPQYDYITMTDHSKFMRVAGGIDEKNF
jgi:DNA polymerase (family 10)